MNLKPGEIICPKCEANHIVGKGKLTIWGCEKCKGTGKLDWIEAVVGKKRITKIEMNKSYGSFIKAKMFCKPIITATQLPRQSKSTPKTNYKNSIDYFGVDYIDLIKP